MSVFDNPLAHRILLIEVHPYDVGTQAVTTKYLASEYYTTEPDDSPANVIYIGAVQDGVRYRRELFAGDKIGGSSIPDRGSLSIINTLEPGAESSRFDDWLDVSKYTWDGRQIEIFVLEKGQPYSNKEKILDSLIDDIDFTENTITFRLKSRQFLLDRTIQKTSYAGTGGKEGGGEIEGKQKPLAFGRVRNISPALIHQGQLIYQFHDGEAESVDDVRDNGVSLTLDTSVGTNGDAADYSTLEAATIAAGQFATCMAEGMVKLGSSPAGQITLDVKGSTLEGTYSASAADIIDYIARVREGCAVKSAAVSALNTANNADVGYYTGFEDVSIKDVFDSLINSIGAYYGFNRLGELDMGRFEEPSSSATLLLDKEDIESDSIERRSTGRMAKEMTLHYRKNWTIQNAASLAGSLNEDVKQEFSEDFLNVTATDNTVENVYHSSKPFAFEVMLYTAADAQSEADRLLSLMKIRRDIFSARTNLKPLQLNLNETIELSHPRFGLSAGRTFRVIGLEEDYLNSTVNITVIG